MQIMKTDSDTATFILYAEELKSLKVERFCCFAVADYIISRDGFRVFDEYEDVCENVRSKDAAETAGEIWDMPSQPVVELLVTLASRKLNMSISDMLDERFLKDDCDCEWGVFEFGLKWQVIETLYESCSSRNRGKMIESLLAYVQPEDQLVVTIELWPEGSE